jgi:hypothetical protein
MSCCWMAMVLRTLCRDSKRWVPVTGGLRLISFLEASAFENRALSTLSVDGQYDCLGDTHRELLLK